MKAFPKSGQVCVDVLWFGSFLKHFLNFLKNGKVCFVHLLQSHHICTSSFCICFLIYDNFKCLMNHIIHDGSGELLRSHASEYTKEEEGIFFYLKFAYNCSFFFFLNSVCKHFTKLRGLFNGPPSFIMSAVASNIYIHCFKVAIKGNTCNCSYLHLCYLWENGGN